MKIPHEKILDPLMRQQAVSLKTTLSRTEIYRRVKCGEFPQPIRIGRTIAWKTSEIDAWIDSLPRGVQKK